MGLGKRDESQRKTSWCWEVDWERYERNQEGLGDSQT